ncbi:histidine kinase [Streptomyces sp. NPDC047315]|uniref:sensor histidine kinase n=1 Tax=Streptomyces sp. NPDC047315 TaxID=3155142 RepID=UPI0034048F7A
MDDEKGVRAATSRPKPRLAAAAAAGTRAAHAHPLTHRLNVLTRRVRALDVRRPWMWDTVVTGFWLMAALIDVTSGGWQRIPHNNDEVPLWLVWAMTFGLSLPLYLRRRRPLAALLMVLPFAFLSAWTGANLQAALLQMVFVFSIALRLRLRILALVLGAIAVPLVVGTFRYPVGSWDMEFVPMLYAFTIVALFGIAVRSRQEYTASLVERAKRLEVERDQQAQLAAAAERTRIAREMHDIIGHNLSVITGLADGGRYAATKSPERAVEALDAISTTSRTALNELRRLLGVLREDAAPTTGTGPWEPQSTPPKPRAPQPALSDLDQLVDGVRAAGLPIRVVVHGRPKPLPPGQQLTVYRVIQEALTNTLKHAGPDASATVQLTHAAGSLTATVTNTGPPPTEPPRADGRGITGMRERTALYEGTLEAAPDPRGGWRVHLHLPIPEDTTP